MKKSAVLVVPGQLETRTGGYIYDQHVVDGLRQHGWSVAVRELDASFPRPSVTAAADAAAAFESIPPGVTIVDSLALGAIPDVIERHATRLAIVALVHQPLASDVELDTGAVAHVREREGRAMRAARIVIVTGRATLPVIASYGVPPSRVIVIEPGTDRRSLARGSSGSPIRLLSVATLNPGKGHESLLNALAAVPTRNWRLTCAGSLTRHPETVTRVRATTRRLGLEDHVTLAGELQAEALEACYDESDVFVLATLRETYGMAVAEALAHGLPVVSTTTGAIPDLVGDEAGLLVSPGDTLALTEALSRMLNDAALRARLADGARRVRERLSGWDEMTRKMADALETVTHG